MNPTELTVNVETGETTIRDLTPEEIAELTAKATDETPTAD